jgi:hypothetical protein
MIIYFSLCTQTLPFCRFTEDHFSGRSLKHAGDRHINGGTNVFLPSSTTIMVRRLNTLPPDCFLSFFDQKKRHVFTRKHNGFQGVG